MKKKWMNIGIIIAVLCICIACVAVFATPGSDNDPLISKSYIDQVVIPQIKQFVEERLASVNNNDGGQTANTETPAFTVVNVEKGKKVICSAGTELILRSGQATIIATPKGGLADTTSGYDLPDGTPMPPNHMLIVPLADGRGIKADTDIIIMVKGGYNISR